MMHLEANGGRGTAPDTQGNGGLALVASPTPDEATMAAIALAIELEGQPEASRIAANRGTSFYALAGRARVLRGR
jgi:hypothetical protein